MTFLLDTNVISEIGARKPDPQVVDWLRAQDIAGIFLSVITVAEIRRGIALSRDVEKRARLELWFEDQVLDAFDGRILPVDVAIADLCGQLVAERQRAGRPIEPFDAVIAATAEVHGLVLVTRNVRDFAGWGGRVFNPWDA